ncbi:MAG: STAS domain-containing protein [Ilumatobacteraceae bacterium]
MEHSRCTLNPATNTAVLDLIGDLDWSGVQHAAALWSHLPSWPTSVILDLTDVSFIDACGLSFLLDLRDEVLGAGSQMYVWALSAPVRRLLDVAGTAALFPVRCNLSASPLVAECA